ncbi:MAG: hypothetical protein SGARI_006884, partial [Bacillariaceae sp.]
MTSIDTKIPLPASYFPLSHTIVIGKGKLPANADGNKRLQSIVQRFSEAYSTAVHRSAKSSIVSDVFFAVEQGCTDDISFVKYNGKHFYRATEHQARDKICSTFREQLADRYKSSSKNKLAKRRQARESKTNNMSQEIQQVLSAAALPFPTMPNQHQHARAVSVTQGSSSSENVVNNDEDLAAVALTSFGDRIPTFGVAADLDHTFTGTVSRSVFDETTPTTTPDRTLSLFGRAHKVSISRGSLLDDDNEADFIVEPSFMSRTSTVS